MLAGQLAIIVAAIFVGVAAYINIAEQPARRDLDSQSLLSEWKIAYKRGFAMQVPLAIAGFLLALLAAWQTANWRWAIGGMILIANLPYTIFEIMPINRQLMSLSGRDSGPAIRTLIERWAFLHAGRTLLGGAATGVLLWASLH
jgi:Domain of unknown function (DUF1772)